MKNEDIITVALISLIVAVVVSVITPQITGNLTTAVGTTPITTSSYYTRAETDTRINTAVGSSNIFGMFNNKCAVYDRKTVEATGKSCESVCKGTSTTCVLGILNKKTTTQPAYAKPLSCKDVMAVSGDISSISCMCCTK